VVSVNNKWWSYLFGVVMLACALLFIVAPFVGWWLPKGVSTHAWEVDRLWYFILAITGFFFILTEAILVYFMHAYASQPGKNAHPGGPITGPFQFFTKWIHNEHRLEQVWTIVPAVILLIIAFAQVNAWANVKYQSRMPVAGTGEGKNLLQVEISARQFEWRMRYPSPSTLETWKTDPAKVKQWVKNPEADDIHVVNELHTWKNHPTIVQVKTIDVIHSFRVFQLRVMQDTLPGKTIPVWFTPTHANTVKKKVKGEWRWQDGDGYDETGKPNDPSQVWEILCSELCGRDHARMIGRFYVHETERDFLEWLKDAQEKQNATAH
jgi:cytochrome c oxidase subunit 2